MATYLVTGGAGFIGSHLVDSLLQAKHRVVVIDNESTGLADYVHPQAIYIPGDVTDAGTLQRAFDHGLDGVFHVAGKASAIRAFHEPQADLTANVEGTLQVLQQCIAYRVPRLLYAGSMTAYGETGAMPIAESHPCRPISYYGITKYTAERYILATAQRVDLDFEFQATVFRMFNVYGPRQRLDNPYQGVMGIFIGAILQGEPITIFGDGEQARDFIHISDVVEAWMLALENPLTYGNVYNLGSGQAISMNQLVADILQTQGKERVRYPIQRGPARSGDQRYTVADTQAIQSVLAWQPQRSLSQGLAETIEWAQSEIS